MKINIVALLPILLFAFSAFAHEPVVNSSTWGIRAVKPGCDYEEDVEKNIIVTLSSGNNSHKGMEGVYAVEARDRARPDFCTIGTNFLIDADDGQIYEGRDTKYKAACSIPNTGVIGITLMGCFDEATCKEELTPVNDAMILSFTELLAELSIEHGIPLDYTHVVPFSHRHEKLINDPKWNHNPGNTIVNMWPRILTMALEQKEAILQKRQPKDEL